MAGTTLDLESILRPDDVACIIGRNYQDWISFRNQWVEEKRELRNYVFATDTTKTTNANLPWKNSTTIPKLCQIRDNLHANYMAALFPHADWLGWEAWNQDSATKKKKDLITAYMYNKLSMSKFRSTVSALLLDWIDYGNCFAMVEWVNEWQEVNGQTLQGYVGPRAVRIDPLDIVFNPVASNFEDSPKIIRSLKSIGELKAQLEAMPNDDDAKKMFAKAIERASGARRTLSSINTNDIAKDDRFTVDGFSSMVNYMQSGIVEVLTFYGDMYDVKSEQFYKNHIITIIDRCYVVSSKPNPSWLGKQSIVHCGWRVRQENLYAMGPLDNLVGMQYRIDHLENAKADAFDLIIHPVIKVTGLVEDFEYGPGQRIFCQDESSNVEFMRPDATMLGARTEIEMLEQKMEDMAGAPKQAMGIRTPGEKTAYEYQALENAAGRIFQNKASYLEENFIEVLVNNMLEMGRRYMVESDVIRVVDDTLAVQLFKTITPEDLTASGRIRPRGASHFARKNAIIQNLNTFLSSAVAQDPAVKVHISGMATAQMFEELLEIERFGLVKENVRLDEQAQTQRIMSSMEEQLGAEQQTASPVTG